VSQTRRPTSDRPRDLGFEPQPMVRWMSPGELSQAALRVVLSGVFGAYADKRELQGVWPLRPFPDYADRDELWVDYVADVADGFDATMTVAATLATRTARLRLDGDATAHDTRRGDVLVMGGDQVYPTADHPTYRNRLIGPYRSAFPAADGDPPDLYALPGNHDWYDGLTSFLRVFCQQRRIGGWQTRQDRSYFALRLPHRWWLWGIDTQFESYLDPAQVSYFRDHVGSHVAPGDQVVLCTASPSWVDANRGEVDAHETIDRFEQDVVAPLGARVRLCLAGDKHHYARYEQRGGDRQFITSGGGGAYLAGTHHLPRELLVPPPDSTDTDRSDPVHCELARTYPSRSESLRLRAGVMRLPFQNGSFWSLLGAFYTVVGWSVLLGMRAPDETFAAMLRDVSWAELVNGLFLRPFGFISAVALVTAAAAFSKAKRRRMRWLLGGSHAIAHLVLLLATVLGAARLLQSLPDEAYVAGVTVTLFGIGGLFGSWLVSLYLLAADRFAHNTNELFAAQHIEGWNNFMRMHIGRDGVLTLFPVRLQAVTRWRFQPDGDERTPWFVPKGAPAEPELIEQPLRFAPDPRPDPSGGTEARPDVPDVTVDTPAAS
jgi:hypothetical protein